LWKHTISYDFPVGDRDVERGEDKDSINVEKAFLNMAEDIKNKTGKKPGASA